MSDNRTNDTHAHSHGGTPCNHDHGHSHSRQNHSNSMKKKSKPHSHSHSHGGAPCNHTHGTATGVEQEEEEEEPQYQCDYCKHFARKVYEGGGCRKISYCGKKCQKRHWKNGHREECKLYRTNLSSTAAATATKN